MTSTTFDPRQYKITTHAQWEDAAEAWHRWGLLIEDWLGPATERMLDAARITTGNSVLDVAAGAGGQSLSAARRVGPTGRVLATDISPTILEYAEKAASDAGLATITTRELDGEHLDVEEGGFDAVISRVGLIYFPDQQAALADMRRALRPGGRLSAVVYSTADRNGFLLSTGRHHPPPHPAAAPAARSAWPVQSREPRVAESTLATAGFRDVDVEAIPSPLRMASAAECVAFERESFGALHQMLSGLPQADRDAAWTEISQALAQFEESDGFVGPCEMLVVSGTR